MTKMKSKTPGAASLVLVLLAISAATALLLGLVNYITADRIKAINDEKTNSAMTEGMPDDIELTALEGEWDSKLVASVFAINRGGSLYGYAVELKVRGFAGTIDMAVDTTATGEVISVSIISHSETSNLGANAEKEDFREQYIGANEALSINKDGGTIDALTGATVTSRAVTAGVNAAIQTVQSIDQGGQK